MLWIWLEYLEKIYFSDDYNQKLMNFGDFFLNTQSWEKSNTIKGKAWIEFRDPLKETLRTRIGDDLATVEQKFCGQVDGLKLSFWGLKMVLPLPPQKTSNIFKITDSQVAV